MKLEFERKFEPKNKKVGLRLTETEFTQVKNVSEINEVSMMEATRQLIRAALKELSLQ